MIIDDIISGVDEGGPKIYYSFKTFIQNLFKIQIENQEKRFLISTKPSMFGNAIALEGFDSFEGEVLK